MQLDTEKVQHCGHKSALLHQTIGSEPGQKDPQQN